MEPLEPLTPIAEQCPGCGYILDPETGKCLRCGYEYCQFCDENIKAMMEGRGE